MPLWMVWVVSSSPLTAGQPGRFHRDSAQRPIYAAGGGRILSRPIPFLFDVVTRADGDSATEAERRLTSEVSMKPLLIAIVA